MITLVICILNNNNIPLNLRLRVYAIENSTKILNEKFKVDVV